MFLIRSPEGKYFTESRRWSDQKSVARIHEGDRQFALRIAYSYYSGDGVLDIVESDAPDNLQCISFDESGIRSVH